MFANNTVWWWSSGCGVDVEKEFWLCSALIFVIFVVQFLLCKMVSLSKFH